MLTGSAKTGSRDMVPLLALACLATFALFYANGAQANSCIATPPVRITGALCGRAMDMSGEVVPDVELRVLDKDGSTVAGARTNSNGDFKFPLLPVGSYRLTTSTPGWKEFIGQVEMLVPNQTSCKKPTTVVLGIQSCEGGISKNKPRHFDEPGW